jgi:probable rRNA maturation factor
MEIDVQSAASGAPTARRIQGFVRRIRRALQVSKVQTPKSIEELSVFFCGDDRMRSLNRRYRGKDRSTDVLAFPGTGRSLGDIVISVPYANRQARRGGDLPPREIDRLMLHGYLHLLGYDHESDRGEMDALESRLRGRLGLNSGGDRPAGGARRQRASAR